MNSDLGLLGSVSTTTTSSSAVDTNGEKGVSNESAIVPSTTSVTSDVLTTSPSCLSSFLPVGSENSVQNENNKDQETKDRMIDIKEKINFGNGGSKPIFVFGENTSCFMTFETFGSTFSSYKELPKNFQITTKKPTFTFAKGKSNKSKSSAITRKYCTDPFTSFPKEVFNFVVPSGVVETSGDSVKEQVNMMQPVMSDRLSQKENLLNGKEADKASLDLLLLRIIAQFEELKKHPEENFDINRISKVISEIRLNVLQMDKDYETDQENELPNFDLSSFTDGKHFLDEIEGRVLKGEQLFALAPVRNEKRYGQIFVWNSMIMVSSLTQCKPASHSVIVKFSELKKFLNEEDRYVFLTLSSHGEDLTVLFEILPEGKDSGFLETCTGERGQFFKGAAYSVDLVSSFHQVTLNCEGHHLFADFVDTGTENCFEKGDYLVRLLNKRWQVYRNCFSEKLFGIVARARTKINFPKYLSQSKEKTIRDSGIAFLF